MNNSHLGDAIFGAPDDDGATTAHPRRQPPVGDPADPTLPIAVPARPATSRREIRERPQPRPSGKKSPVADDGRKSAIRGCLAMVIGVVVIGAALIFAIGALGSSWLPSFSSNAAGGDYQGPGTGTVTIVIQPGDSGAAIGQTLQQAGVVKSASTFTDLAAGSAGFAALQPGSYRMRSQMSSAGALALLLQPGTKLAGVTIPEGLWATEIYARLSKATKVPLADYAKVSAASLGLPVAAGGKVEGYLFPSTYNFPKGASAQVQLKTMVTQFKKQTAALNIAADRLAMVTTVASLVQAEASRTQDEGKVARVIDNRLAAKMPLQFDSTVNYVLKSRGTVTTSGKARESASPYNTYKRPGLPPGPIDNPGVAALKAALNPTPGSWIYFVTVDLATGQTVFSPTAAQHQAAVKQFQTWCGAHPGKC
ncbi:MAG: endolytic transglycosylase MltG [Actinomycetota bacterium]|nr:endolytic transglycosylase MltG [Actinomycetota bacterium]